MPIAPRSIADAFGPPPDHKPLPTDTLMRALDKLRAGRWRGHRSKDVLYSQGARTVETLGVVLRMDEQQAGRLLVSAVSPAAVSQCIDLWLEAKRAPDTIRKRLNVLRAMGVDLGAAADRPKLSKKGPLKWWLSPSDEGRLLKWLAGPRHGTTFRAAALTACYIRFVTRSGLRVEEALAVTPQSISYVSGSTPHRERASITVMGTKTAGSHATLPLMPEAYDALDDAWRLRHGEPLWEASGETHYLTPILFLAPSPASDQYTSAAAIWEKCREFLGQKDNPTATLKALRRSAARYLHITKGMPLDMVREYLRHDDIETTQGYLKLTGGYGEAEMRKWLTKDS